MSTKSSPQLNQLVEVESAKTVVLAGFFPPVEMVPVRPICVNLGIDRKWQQKRIQNDPELSQLGGVVKAIAVDGKAYDTYCLNIRGIQMWLWSLNDTPNLNTELLYEYRKYLAIDIQERLQAMLKVSLDEVQRLRNIERAYKDLKAMSSSMLDKQLELKRLTQQRREVAKTSSTIAEQMQKLFVLDENQLALFQD